MNRKLNVELTSHQADLLRRAVAAGRYTGADEIFSEALDDWFAKRDAMDSDIELLRRLCNVGIGNEIPAVDLAGLRKASRSRSAGA